MSELNETPAGSQEVDERSTPSRVAEAPSDLVRTTGLGGSVFFLVGVSLWLWNVLEQSAAASTAPTEPRFRWLVIRVWLLLGTLAMLFHAVKDPVIHYRRLYGLLAVALTGLGMTLSTYLLVAQSIIQASGVAGYPPDDLLLRARLLGGLAAGLVALVGLCTALAPFVAMSNQAFSGPRLTPFNFFPRLVACIRSDSDLQRLALGGLLLAALAVTGSILIHMPLRELGVRIDKLSPENLLAYGMLPYGLLLSFLGVPFAMVFARQEEEEAWRLGVAAPVGFSGALAALAGFSTLFTDLTPLGDLVAPYGLALLLLGFVQLWAFLACIGADSDMGYRAAFVMRLVGFVVAVAACGRSLYPALADWALQVPSLADRFGRADLASYLVPNGFLLMLAGLIFGFFGYAATSDSKLIVLTRRELASYFYSPIAYMVIGGVTLVAWLQFLQWIDIVEFAGREGVPEPIVRYILLSIFSVIALPAVVPMLTMRLLSEEQRTGTMEVLLTAPVNEGVIVLSKFLASWIMFMIAWSVWLFFPLVLRVAGQEAFDYRPLLSFFLGLSMMSAGFLAMGLFFSSLTKNQIIAFLLGLAGMALLIVPFFFIEEVTGTASARAEMWRYFSFIHHQIEFMQGRVHLKHLMLYVSFAVFWLFLTVKVLEARKWR